MVGLGLRHACTANAAFLCEADLACDCAELGSASWLTLQEDIFCMKMALLLYMHDMQHDPKLCDGCTQCAGGMSCNSLSCNAADHITQLNHHVAREQRTPLHMVEA